jgi:hypothetical protein
MEKVFLLILDKEYVKISDELIKNKNSFTSHVIESEYIKKDVLKIKTEQRLYYSCQH